MVPQKFSNPQRKAMLVDALRSDEFQQGRARLNRNGRMCCLGVLCELARRDGLPLHVDIYDVTFYDANSLYPPRSVKEWAGLPSDDRPGEGLDVIVELDRDITLTDVDGDSVFHTKGTKVGLGELNDGGVPFSVIADIIEKCM
jgi:hypothetical protein